MLSPEDVFPHIQTIYRESLIELFSGLNCEVEQVNDLDRELTEEPIARIDCGSSELEFTILVRIPMSVLALTYPAPKVIEIDESELEDWISEISNQLLGKIKARLAKHECDVNIGLPSAFFDCTMASLMPDGGLTSGFYFLIDNEPCETLLCMEAFEDRIQFNLEETEQEDPFADGEMEFF